MENNNYNMYPLDSGISQFPPNPVVAMAYVPYQNPVTIYSANQGIERGTMFPCLDKPFCGRGVNCK